MISPDDTDDFMKDLSELVDQHIDDDNFGKQGHHVLEEIFEEGPTDQLPQDIVDTSHRMNSLCAMIIEKYGLGDEESFSGRRFPWSASC